MADITPVASPQFLREAEIRRGIELLYFGYGNMIKGADARLAETGLGRAHHRALYFIARRPGMPVSDRSPPEVLIGNSPPAATRPLSTHLPPSPLRQKP